MCGSCGDRTTATESKQVECPCVFTANIGASALKRHTNYTNFTFSGSYSMTSCSQYRYCSSISGKICLCRAENRNGEKSKAPAPFQKRPYMYAYSMVILNAFPLLTFDKKLSLEVTSKLERLEYSYKHCTNEEGVMVGV